MPQSIIIILTQQHEDLMSSLVHVKALTVADSLAGGEIVKKLSEFKKMLSGHVELENTTFYPQLLKLKKERGMDVVKTEEFMGKMADINDQVNVFLKKYDSGQKVFRDLSVFKVELSDITDILNLRIEAEESFVFVDWEMLNNK